MKIISALRAASAALFVVWSSVVLAQNSGTVPNHAIPIGKGAGVQGFGSLLLGSGQIPMGQSSANPTAVTPAGDVTIGTTGTTAIGANRVTNAQIRQSGALALIGRSANSTGNVADIQATAGSSCAFVETSSTIACAQLQTAGLANNAVTNAKLAQGAATTIKANPTGSLANEQDITLDPSLQFSGTTLKCTPGSASQSGCLQPDNVTITIVGGKAVASGGSATTVTVGSTTIGGSPPAGGYLYNNAGVLGAFSPGPLTNSIGSNVSFSTATYTTTGPSIAQGSVGTWWVSGQVTIIAGASAIPYCKLWDGTTVIASGGINNGTGAARIMIPLSGFIVNPAGNISIQCSENNGASDVMQANTTANGKDSTVSAYRIQ